MASSAHRVFLLAFLAVLAAAAPRAADAWGSGRLFFSKTTRAQAAVEPDKAAAAAAAATNVPDAADPNSAPAFARPSTGGSSRGYGLYGRPEENYPPAYYRSGVHRNAEKLTTTSNVPATTTTDTEEEEEAAAAVGGGGERVEPFPENGSGRGRPPYYYTGFRGGGGRQPEQQRDYGMSDTRLYQNGRYYYDVGSGRYGYGRESNPVRTRPEEFVAGDRRRRYGGSAAAGYEYANGDEFGNNGVAVENQNGFQEEGRNGRYDP